MVISDVRKCDPQAESVRGKWMRTFVCKLMQHWINTTESKVKVAMNGTMSSSMFNILKLLKQIRKATNKQLVHVVWMFVVECSKQSQTKPWLADATKWKSKKKWSRCKL